MKKTLTININGFNFTIDEDAFEHLSFYIEALNQKFINTEGGKEIIGDIEARIAELFRQKLGNDKQVITIDDVKEIIQTMGTVEDFEDSDEQENKDMKQSDENKSIKEKKRIYRDTDNRIMGGVCSGLANYFGIDPVIMRVIFVIAFFIYGSSFAIYIVLWIITPEAKTTAQKLEMKGEKVTASSIEKSIRNEFDNVKKNFNNWANRESYTKTKSSLMSIFDSLGPFVLLILKVFVIFIAICFIVIGTIGLAGMVAGIIFNHTFFLPHINSSNIPFEYVKYFADSISFKMMLVSIFLVAGIPLLLLIVAGLKILLKSKFKSKLLSIVLILAFVVGICMMIISSVKIASNYKFKGKYQKDYTIDSKHETWFLEIQKSTDSDETIVDLDSYKLSMNNNIHSISGKPRINIIRNINNKIEIEIKYESRGKSQKQANELSRKINYNWIQSDSVIKFDEYFNIQETMPWRKQSAEIIIKVPVGQKIFLAHGIEDMIYDIKNKQDMWDSEMVGKYWLMTETGLDLISENIFTVQPINPNETKDSIIHELKRELNDLKNK